MNTALAEQGYSLNYQDSSGNLWRRLELTQTSLTTQGATLNFDKISLNYNLIKFFRGEKPLGIRLSGVDGDLFLKELAAREQSNSPILIKYLEDLSIEDISLNLQDVPYDLPEFSLSNLELLAFDPDNTQIRGDLQTDKGRADIAVYVESIEPLKARINILEADAVLAQHWTKRVLAGQVSGQVELDAGEVIGDFQLLDSQLSVADIDISDVAGQFKLVDNQLEGELTANALGSNAVGDLLVDIEKQQWQSKVTSTADLSEASAWIFRKSPMVHDYLKLSGQAPIELNLSGWQDVEVKGKVIAQEGLEMMSEPLENVETDIYFVEGRTDVIVKADYRQGQMDYVRIALDQETKLDIQDVVFVDADNQQASLDAEVVFATDKDGLKKLTGPLSINYVVGTEGKKENFKVDVLSVVAKDDWDFDVVLTDDYGNSVNGDVFVNSSDTMLSLRSERLDINYLDRLIQVPIISELSTENANLRLKSNGLSQQERLELSNLNELRNLISNVNQISVSSEALSVVANGESFTSKSLNANLDNENTRLDVAASELALPFESLKNNLLDVDFASQNYEFKVNVLADKSPTNLLDARQLSVAGRFSDQKSVDIQELILVGLSASGELQFAEALSLESLTRIDDVIAGARASLNYKLSDTGVVIEDLSQKSLQVSGTGTLNFEELVETQAEFNVQGVDLFGLPEVLKVKLDWQQNGELNIVDTTSGLSLQRKLVPVASNLGMFTEAESQNNTIAVSELTLENTSLELLGQSFLAKGTVTVLPNSEPIIDAVLQTTDSEIDYQIKAKGDLENLALEVVLPAFTDILNNGQLVTKQELLFQGSVNLSAKQLSMTSSLNPNPNLVITTTDASLKDSADDIRILANWFEKQNGTIESINLEAAHNGLIARTSISDVENLEAMTVNLSGKGSIDRLTELFAYAASGNLDTRDSPVNFSFAPFHFVGDASFVGQFQGQDLNLSAQGQGDKIIADVALSLLGQEQVLRGEVYPSLRLTTNLPYLGDVLVSGQSDALQLSGQGVLDIQQFVPLTLSGLAIDPQSWQLTGSLNAQEINLNVGESVAKLRWSEEEAQDLKWSLITEIDQSATWQNTPVTVSARLQHSSEQEVELFQGELLVDGITIELAGNRNKLDVNSRTQVDTILSSTLIQSFVDAETRALLIPLANEAVNLEGLIEVSFEDLALSSYDFSGQVSNESPVDFEVNNQSASIDGSTELLSRIDWAQRWGLVGEMVGSSLKTASTISLTTDLQSELNLNLDNAEVLATIPLDNNAPVKLDTTVAWLQKWLNQTPVEVSQVPFQAISGVVPQLFSSQEVVYLETDVAGQNLSLAIGSGNNTVNLSVENIATDDIKFSTQIPNERLLVWQSTGLFAEQSIIPSNLLELLTSRNDLELYGSYNRTNQKFSTTVQNDYGTASIDSDLSLSRAINFNLNSSVGLLQSTLKNISVNNQIQQTLKDYVNGFDANDSLVVEGSFSLSGQYHADLNIKQQSGEVTTAIVSIGAGNSLDFAISTPAILLRQPALLQTLPTALQTIASQIPLQDNVDLKGRYYLDSNSYELDVGLQHVNNKSILNIVRNIDNQLALNLDMPAAVATNLVTGLVQLPSQLGTVLAAVDREERLGITGKYDLQTQEYNFNFDLQQTGQAAIPFGVTNAGDGSLRLTSDIATFKIDEYLQQSGLLQSLPVSFQDIARNYLIQTSDLIRIQGDYDLKQQRYDFSADMLQQGQQTSRMLLQGDAVQGIEIIFDGETSLLGGLELSQLPLNNIASTIISDYLKSPNTQNFQLKTQINSNDSHPIEITVNHPNLSPTRLSAILQNNKLVEATVLDSPISIVKDLLLSQNIDSITSVDMDNALITSLLQSIDTETVDFEARALANNGYQIDVSATNLNNMSLSAIVQNNKLVEATVEGTPISIIKEVLLSQKMVMGIDNDLVTSILQSIDTETVNFKARPLANNSYQIDILAANLTAVVTTPSQTQATPQSQPIQFQISLPSDILRKVNVNPVVVNNWLKAVPLQDTVAVYGNYYLSNGLYEVNSRIEHGANLSSELFLSNFDANNKFKVATPLVYVPSNIANQFALPNDFSQILNEWLKGNHNSASVLELEGVLQAQNINIEAVLNHNGYSASTLSLQQNADRTNFAVDTPAQPLTTLQFVNSLGTTQLSTLEPYIRGVLNQADRLKVAGQSQNSILGSLDDVDLDLTLTNANGLSDESGINEFSAQVQRSSGQYLVSTIIGQESLRNILPQEVLRYLPSLNTIDTDISWSTLDEVSIEARAKNLGDTGDTIVMQLQGLLSNSSDFSFQTQVDAELYKSIPNLDNVLFVNALDNLNFSGNVNLQSRNYVLTSTATEDIRNLRIEGDTTYANISSELDARLLNLTDTPIADYISQNQVSTVSLNGNYGLQNRNYTLNTILNSNSGNSSFDVQGNQQELSFSGQLLTQLIKQDSLAQEFQTVLSEMSYLPIQGSYSLISGGGVKLQTQLDASGNIMASLDNGRLRLQTAGLSIDYIPSTDASWFVSFDNFDPQTLKVLDFYQDILLTLGINAEVLSTLTSLNGDLRRDASVWQGEIVARTNRQDVSDIRILGQGEALYIQSTVLQFGQQLAVSGPIYPQLELQVQGDYVDAKGVARARLEGRLKTLGNWQQLVLDGMLSTLDFQNSDLLVPAQQIPLQASVTNLQNWQETLSVKLGSQESSQESIQDGIQDSISQSSILTYEENQLTGSLPLGVSYNGEPYSITLKANSAPLTLVDLNIRQLQDLNLQVDLEGDLFSATLDSISFETNDVINSVTAANIVLNPKSEVLTAFTSTTFPLESLGATNTQLIGRVSYDLTKNRLELNASAQPYEQNAVVTFLSEAGQIYGSLTIADFQITAIPELNSLAIPKTLEDYFKLDEARNLNVTFDSTGVRFDSLANSLSLKGQVVDGLVDVSGTYPQGDFRVYGTNLNSLQVSLLSTDLQNLLTLSGVNLGESILANPEVTSILNGQFGFDGTLQLNNGVNGTNLNGISRLGDYDIQTSYLRDSSATLETVKLDSTFINKTISFNSRRDLVSTPEIWQVNLDYVGTADNADNTVASTLVTNAVVSGTVENRQENLLWNLESSRLDLNKLPTPLRASVSGELSKTDWQPIGNFSATSLEDSSAFNVDGQYRSTQVNWQMKLADASEIFTELPFNIQNLQGDGVCNALVCSLSQAQFRSGDVIANLRGELSPSIDIYGNLNHPLLQAISTNQSFDIRLSQDTNEDYVLSLSHQDLRLQARANPQFQPQSVDIQGSLSYQDGQTNRYLINSQDLSWTVTNGYQGSVELSFERQFAAYQVDTTLSLRAVGESLNITGPVYLNQELVATSNLDLGGVLPDLNSGNLNVISNSKLSGYFDVDAPLKLLNPTLPSSLGNLKTRLNVVEKPIQEGDSSLFSGSVATALPFYYYLTGSVDNLASISTRGSLTLDLQSGAGLDLTAESINGVKLKAEANTLGWQAETDIAGLVLTPDVVSLLPLAQAERENLLEALAVLRESISIDADFSLQQSWAQPLEIKENQVELRAGSSHFMGQIELADRLALVGQVNVDGQDLARALPVNIDANLAGGIMVNADGQVTVTDSLFVESNIFETLTVSGDIWPPALYVQSFQDVRLFQDVQTPQVSADYLYISGQTNGDIMLVGNLKTKLKSVPDALVNITVNENQSLIAAINWQGFNLQTTLPATFDDLSNLQGQMLNFDLSGYVGQDNRNPINAKLKIDNSTAVVDSFSIIDDYGQLNLSGSIDLTSIGLTSLGLTSIDSIRIPSFSEVFNTLSGQLTGVITPNWSVISRDVTLPTDFDNTLSSLPVTASIGQSKFKVSSTSTIGTIGLETGFDFNEIILDAALSYSLNAYQKFNVNGQANYSSQRVSGSFRYEGFGIVYAGEEVNISGEATLLNTGLAANGSLSALEQSATYNAEVGWLAVAQRLERQLSLGGIATEVSKRLPQANVQEDIRIDVSDFSAKAITPLQRVLPYFSPDIDGTITISNDVLVGTFKSELLTANRRLPVDIRLDGILRDVSLSEATVSLVIDESPAKAIVDFQLRERIIDGRIRFEYFPMQTLLGIVPQDSQVFENVLEPFTAGLTTGLTSGLATGLTSGLTSGLNEITDADTDAVRILDLRVTGVGTAYIPFDQLQQSQVLLVAEQVIFEHESFVREESTIMSEALRTQGQLTLRYQQEILDIEQAQFQSYRLRDQSLAGNWSASGQISEDRLSLNLSAESADLSPFILLSPSLVDLSILAKGNFNISAQGSLREPVIFFSSNQFQADIAGGYVESEDLSFILENGMLQGRARLAVERPWQSDIEAEFEGPVSLWPFDIDRVVVDFQSPAFATNFFGDFKTIDGQIYNQDGMWWLNAVGDLDNPFQISGTLKPLALQFTGNQLNLYSEAFFVASSQSDINLSLSYEVPNLVLRGAVVANQAELVTRASVNARRSNKPQFFERILFDNILLTAPRNMIFSESFLTAELATELYLDGSLAAATLDGTANLLEGELRYSGQSFMLSDGTATFDKLRGIYPTISARAYANLDKTKLSNNPQSYVLQPNTNQFQLFLNANGGYTFLESEDRYRLDLQAVLSSNAIIDPSNPRTLTEEDIVSLLTLKRIATDTTGTSENVIGEIVGVNVIGTATDIIEGAIGAALGEGVDIRTSGLSSLITDSSNPENIISDPFGFGVRFSGYLEDSVFASYELGRFTDPNYSLSNQLILRYDDIFGLNRLGFNLSTGLNFENGSSDPLIDLNLGLDYDINETISLSISSEISSEVQELGFGIRYKW